MARLIPTFDLGSKIGAREVAIEASTVKQMLEQARERFGEPFRAVEKKVTVLVNGRNINQLGGQGARLGPDDVVWLVYPSGGG